MSFIAYKNRQLDPNKPVMVYKNLHNGLFSLKQGDLVIGHTSSVMLKNVTFRVLKRGRERVLTEKKKNVHAFICGFVVDFSENHALKGEQVTYNPYKYSTFITKSDEQEAVLSNHEMLYCNVKKGIFIQQGNLL